MWKIIGLSVKENDSTCIPVICDTFICATIQRGPQSRKLHAVQKKKVLGKNIRFEEEINSFIDIALDFGTAKFEKQVYPKLLVV